MKKLIVGALALLVAANMNAAVIATVNGQEITDEEANALLRQVTGGVGGRYESLNDEYKKQVIDQLVERKLLVSHAVKSGIEKDSKYIKTLAQAKSDIALNIWIEKEFDKLKITDAQVKQYYDENTDKFPLKPESWAVSHILVKDEATAKKIIKELNNSKDLPAKFAEAVQKYSEDNASKATNGSVGIVTKQTQFVKEFLDATFAMKKGDLSKTPVKTVHGFHILYITDKIPESKYTFEEIKDELTNNVVKRVEFQKSLESQVQKLKDKAKIEIK
ncbi:MAG: peptidyl-prolyl cis-trans isomerase [Campylobacteraceae bacterium]|jgi:peptidylprolyl isomerase|nr:peptidyl-prolyl cis-trans isomerase [Campylobacteraceae bacterium]